MSDLTRRRFVRNSAGAAAGLTVVGALGAARADAAEKPGSDPLVAYVKDPSNGEIAILSGKHETIIHDRGLAARIARAAR